jgi:predicted DNA repair protein MutK
MATSLLALIDDIATILDDVAVMTKVAAKKTAGVLGDDLALNAQQVVGVSADRELPVVWAVAKGSAVNKLILVPAALAISFFLPTLITPLLMLGGAYLCFEGMEKIVHNLFHHDKDHHDRIHAAVANSDTDWLALEKDKIKGAIRTDFILSAEIIVIALGTVSTASFSKQATVVVAISIIMTVGVYGLVAAIVKLDDFGFYLLRQPSVIMNNLGRTLLWFAPKLMKTLSVVGTAAMFMVGGGILMHGFTGLYHYVDAFTTQLGWFKSLAQIGFDALLGVISGTVLVACVMLFNQLRAQLKVK